jgi:hypothetical protein
MESKNENSEKIYVQLKKFFLRREIAHFYSYLETMEKPLLDNKQATSSEIKEFEAKIHKLGNSDEHRAELIELLVEESRLEGVTNLMRQSFFVSLYAFLELWIMRDCYVECKRRNLEDSFSKLQRKGIYKAKDCFTKVLESDFPFGSSKEWEKIVKYKLLRDCIVHRQGSLTGLSDFDIDKRLEKFIEKEDSLYLYGGKQIGMKYEFCIEALQTVHRFMELLLLPRGAA